MMRVTSIELSERIAERLEKLSAETDQPASVLVSDAVEKYLDYEEWFRSALRKGIEQADAGQLIPHEQVMERLEGILKRAAERST